MLPKPTHRSCPHISGVFGEIDNISTLRQYIIKILCRMEKLSDKEIQEKAGSISKLGDYALKGEQPPEGAAESEEAEEQTE